MASTSKSCMYSSSKCNYAWLRQIVALKCIYIHCLFQTEDTKFDGVTVRVYRPVDLSDTERLPGVVYFHGGGWCYDAFGNDGIWGDSPSDSFISLLHYIFLVYSKFHIDNESWIVNHWWIHLIVYLTTLYFEFRRSFRTKPLSHNTHLPHNRSC